MNWIASSEKDTDNTALEKRLCAAADQCRANSGLKSQEHSAPVLGLVFLRFSEVRFIARRATLTRQPSPGSASQPVPVAKGRGEGAVGRRRGNRADDPTAYHAEGVLSAYDELMENSQRRIRILEATAPAPCREWFVHFRFPGYEKTSYPAGRDGSEGRAQLVTSPLGNIPQGWKVGRLDDVLVLQRGFDLPKADRVRGAVPIYAATGVTGFHNGAKVKAPGVVTGRSGTIGDASCVQEDLWPLNTALWVKEFPKPEPLDAHFVLSALDLTRFNSGAAVLTINRNDIHGLVTLIPPRPLQERFQEIAGAMLAQARTLELQVQNLRRTRDLLLPRLCSGQVNLKEN